MTSTETLQHIRDDLGDCTRCRLCETRNNIVFGNGNPCADWLFIAEAPGKNEDKQGLPFVGKAGTLLNRLIKESGWDRESVFVLNVVKCRPPGNRDPAPDEIEACRPFLFRQIHAIQPKVITTLGKPAANLLLNTKQTMGRLRGTVVDFMGAKVIPTYHPSYIQRGNWKKLELMQDDFSLAVAYLLEEGIILPDWEDGKNKL